MPCVLRVAYDSQNYFALIKCRDAIRPQLTYREIRWLSLAMQAFLAQLSFGNIIFHYTVDRSLSFDCSDRKVILPSSRRIVSTVFPS